MKKVVIMLALCLLSVSLFAQDRVAILPFTGGEGREGDTVARLLGTELTKLGNFEIVPRTAAINKVMEEHDFQRGGLTDGDTIVALGKGVNAKYVISGHIQTLGSKKMISASIVDVETFQQVAGDYYEYDDLSEVAKYLPTLAGKLVSKTKNNYSGVPTLAILPFDGVDESNADVLAQLLAIELSNSGKYLVVSRTTTVENIMKEQNIQRSGLTDGDSISKLGIAMNADYVLCGSASNLGSIGMMNVEIIDVLTLAQENGAYTQYETIEDGARLMPVLSYDLTGIITRYTIGGPGPGGGMIFYIDGDKYLEVSENLGTATWSKAIQMGKNYRGGGYNDWYLPNKEELNYIYENLRKKGIITDDGYFWSSSEGYYNSAWVQGFSDGYQLNYGKTRNHTNVRVVRAFNPSTL